MKKRESCGANNIEGLLHYFQTPPQSHWNYITPAIYMSFLQKKNLKNRNSTKRYLVSCVLNILYKTYSLYTQEYQQSSTSTYNAKCAQIMKNNQSNTGIGLNYTTDMTKEVVRVTTRSNLTISVIEGINSVSFNRNKLHS